KNDQAFETTIDRNEYQDSDLITIRIPLSMPYQPGNTDFERVSGEVTIGNVIYKYVKRKIDQGDLVLLCLPDRKKTELVSGKDAFFKLATEFQQINTGKHQGGKTTGIFKLSVFPLSGIIDLSTACNSLGVPLAAVYNCTMPLPCLRSLDRPPETAVA